MGACDAPMLFLFLEKNCMHLIGKIIFVLRKKITWGASWGASDAPHDAPHVIF